MTLFKDFEEIEVQNSLMSLENDFGDDCSIIDVDFRVSKWGRGHFGSFAIWFILWNRFGFKNFKVWFDIENTSTYIYNWNDLKWTQCSVLEFSDLFTLWNKVSLCLNLSTFRLTNWLIVISNSWIGIRFSDYWIFEHFQIEC